MCVPAILRHFCVLFLCVNVIIWICFVRACVLPVVQRAHLNMCRLVTGRKPLIWQTCVGRLRSGSAVWLQTESSSLFASVCVCLNVSVCGVVKGWKRASVHMGTNDRIWFSEPVCKEEKKMKETKLVKISAETSPDLPQRFHCSVRWSVDAHRFSLCTSSTVMSHHDHFECHHCF